MKKAFSFIICVLILFSLSSCTQAPPPDDATETEYTFDSPYVFYDLECPAFTRVSQDRVGYYRSMYLGMTAEESLESNKKYYNQKDGYALIRVKRKTSVSRCWKDYDENGEALWNGYTVTTLDVSVIYDGAGKIYESVKDKKEIKIIEPYFADVYDGQPKGIYTAVTSYGKLIGLYLPAMAENQLIIGGDGEYIVFLKAHIVGDELEIGFAKTPYRALPDDTKGAYMTENVYELSDEAYRTAYRYIEENNVQKAPVTDVRYHYLMTKYLYEKYVRNDVSDAVTRKET